jgi:hypothetical protein
MTGNYAIKSHCRPIADPSLIAVGTPFPALTARDIFLAFLWHQHFSGVSIVLVPVPLVSQKRTPILEVVLEIGTVIVRMVKTAARTTVKRVGDGGPADPTSEDSGEAAGITPASLIKPQGNRWNPSRGCNSGKRYSNLSP